MADGLGEVHKRTLAALTDAGAPFEVTDVEAQGRRTRVYANADRDLNAFFAEVERTHRDKTLLIYEDRSWTYGEVMAEARRLAGSLAGHYGVGPGSRVGLAMRNRPEWFSGFIAIQRLGAVAVLFNSRGAAAELESAAALTDCCLIIADQQRAELFAEAKVAAPVAVITDAPRRDRVTFADLAAEGPAETSAVEVEPDAPAVIMFTSGTTGRAKGATLTQRNLVNMIHNIRMTGAVATAMAAHRLGVDVAVLRKGAPALSLLMVTPLFHISGVTNFLLACVSGGRILLIRRWDASQVLALIARHGVTNVSGPTMVLSDLLDQPDAERHLANLATFTVAGQATPLNLLSRVSRMIPKASQGSGWGSTETAGSVSSASGALLLAYPGTVGRPSPIVEVRVVDPSGRVLPPGEVGEFQVRGGVVMTGYWNAPEATAAVFEDGWYRMGDLGYLSEEGFIYLVDRAKDMVISAGENIYCAEVERVLCSAPEFGEAALFGVPDARLGERAVAAVVLRPGEATDEGRVKAFVRAQLADYKVPTEVVFDIAPLPRNPVGKVDKVKLRQAYLDRSRQSA